MKELLKELCDSFQAASSHKIELISGLKPEGYYLPVNFKLAAPTRMAWFVEIWIDDDKCIARQSYYDDEPLDVKAIEATEERLSRIIIKEIFNHGIFRSINFKKA